VGEKSPIEVKIMIPKCVGCGYCCWEMPCALAIELHGSITTCPELVWDGNRNRYKCAVIDIRRIRGDTNEFCCHPENRWRLNVKQRKEVKSGVN
jgi:hypothetical protein